MVDVLRECSRVLRPGGTLLDLRPLASPRRIERIDGEGTTRIGELDGSPGLTQDVAADAAISQMHAAGTFLRGQRRRLDLWTYWRPMPFFAHLSAGYSTRERKVTTAELGALRLAGGSARQIRVHQPMQLGAYERP
jgi:hypothetical protein